ncbi:MAG: ABC transporter ATP-binding protein [Bacillota bacterium]|nr:ABC transporter ATP-binding protein [Bacillota bacterium]
MVLEINNLSKTFKTKTKETAVFKSIDLKIDKGQFICLIGPSGCGKSTLLNIIAGHEKANEGEVLLEGKAVTTPGPDRIMMFQESALFPWLKVIDNVIFGLKIAGVSKDEAYATADRYLHMTHLSQFKNAYIHELSGGMRQRVALARCLSMDSEIMLMDEPFASLDSQTRLILQLELQRIWEATKKTIVFVTHSVEEAVLLSDKIVLMSVNPGGIKKIYDIDIPRPREVDSEAVVHKMSIVLKDLKEEVEKVAKAEFDTDWHL